jgi:protein-L-isoaspartate O-methyltransferase
MSLDQHRTFYADLVTAKGGTRDQLIRSAFASVPRERFVGPGPWKVFSPLGYIRTGWSELPNWLEFLAGVTVLQKRLMEVT